MPQFESTIKHLTGDLKAWGVAAAVKNIEGWEEKLKAIDVSGAKGIIGDLEKLKKHLHGDSPDGSAINGLLEKLGTATVNIAKRVDGTTTDRLTSLGNALLKSGGHPASK